MRLRHQLPVYSPLPLGALLRGSGALVPAGSDPRKRLLARVLERTRAEAGLLTDSGTSALRVALTLLKDQGLVPVALPGFTCYDVATAAVGADVPVLLYDINPRDLSADLASLERSLAAGARSVVIAPLYGFPVDWDGVRALTESQGVPVIEDAAQAHGSTYGGRPWGTHGDLAILSFGRGKGWTGGGGGALVAHDHDLASLVGRLPSLPSGGFLGPLRDLALAWIMWCLARPALYGLPRSIPALGLGETRYKEPQPPHGMSRITAALALGSEEAADREVVVRRKAGEQYREGIGASAENESFPTIPAPVAGGSSGYLRFPVVMGGRHESLEGTLPEGLRATGIERGYPQALSRLPALRGRILNPDTDLSGSADLARGVITLPTHSRTRPSERLRALRAVREPARGATSV